MKLALAVTVVIAIALSGAVVWLALYPRPDKQAHSEVVRLGEEVAQLHAQAKTQTRADKAELAWVRDLCGALTARTARTGIQKAQRTAPHDIGADLTQYIVTLCDYEHLSKTKPAP